MKRAVVVLFVLISGLVLACSAVLSPLVNATALDPSWMSGDAKYEAFDATPLEPKRCVIEYRQLSSIMDRQYALDSNQLCVFKSRGFQYASYQREFYRNPSLPSAGISYEQGVAFAPDDASAMIPTQLDATTDVLERLYTGSESEIFVKQIRESSYTHSVTLYRNPLSHMYIDQYGLLQFQDDGYYKLKVKENEVVNFASALGGSVSSNGQFFTFAIENVGYAILDMFATSGRIITKNFDTSQYIWPSPSPTLASDDFGKYIITGGWNVSTAVYGVSDNCGVPLLETIEVAQVRLMRECESRDITSLTNEHSRPGTAGLRNFLNVKMSSRGDSFSYFDAEKWATVYAPNYIAPESMDYIALGDSFSSGEGDYYHPEGSHYLPLTNILGSYREGVPRELCHLSDRSYPFLLAKDMGVGRGSDMQSVACSGAVRFDIASGQIASGVSPSYLGQNAQLQDSVVAPRLRAIIDAEPFKSQARTSFIPGRVQQIEFIKKYHPKVATIGISGNDIGFGAILSACLLNDRNKVCEYATPEGLKTMGQLIHGNYIKQVELYRQLKLASPGTDFYAVGYPQFIGEDSLVCWSLGNTLNIQERSMINKSVSYLNQVIKSAATSAGIKYINIEDALKKDTMCGAGSGAISHPLDKALFGFLTGLYLNFEDEYLTNSSNPAQDYLLAQMNVHFRDSTESLSSNPITAAMLFMSETFHPNAVGHQHIYEYIHRYQKGKSLLDAECDGFVIVCPGVGDDATPAIPEDFGSDDEVKAKVESFMWSFNDSTRLHSEIGVGGAVVKGANVQIRPTIDAQETVKDIKLFLHSEPILLGEVTIENGVPLPIEVIIPTETPAGFHSLVLEGRSANGQLVVKHIQPIFVSGITKDIDGDGMNNEFDTCQFIVPSGLDSDSDGIDDNCDLMVNDSQRAEVDVENDDGVEAGVHLFFNQSDGFEVSGAEALCSFAQRNDERICESAVNVNPPLMAYELDRAMRGGDLMGLTLPADRRFDWGLIGLTGCLATALIIIYVISRKLLHDGISSSGLN